MIEVVGPATVATFDGHVLELFQPDGSRRLHVSQIAAVEIGSFGMLLPGPILEVRTVDGDQVVVPFDPEQGHALEGLLEALALRR